MDDFVVEVDGVEALVTTDPTGPSDIANFGITLFSDSP